MGKSKFSPITSWAEAILRLKYHGEILVFPRVFFWFNNFLDQLIFLPRADPPPPHPTIETTVASSLFIFISPNISGISMLKHVNFNLGLTKSQCRPANPCTVLFLLEGGLVWWCRSKKESKFFSPLPQPKPNYWAELQSDQSFQIVNRIEGP